MAYRTDLAIEARPYAPDMVQSKGERRHEFNRSLGPAAEQEAIRIWISLYPASMKPI